MILLPVPVAPAPELESEGLAGLEHALVLDLDLDRRDGAGVHGALALEGPGGGVKL